MTELLESIDAKKPATEILSEVADVTILLHRVVGTLGLELSEVVDRKMSINRDRIWQKSGNGVGQHK